MTKFSDLKLDPKVLQAIAEAGYETPTPIQAGAIPPALEGRDVLGIAQTGTGKTASFTLPMITLLGRGRARARMPRSLVLCPTRELAAQVAENFDIYAKHTRLTKALLIGGVSFGEQDKLIDRGVDVLIATPGRLLDHFERGKLLLTGVQIMVVDEADRMLDMGFIPDIERIFQLTPFTRQTLFFSATMAPEIERITDTFLHSPERIEVARQATTSETITQKLVEITPTRRDQSAKQKRELLRALIDAEGEALKNAIIFCNRKTDVDIVAKSLKAHGYDAAPIHGDLDQRHRMATLDDFREGKLRFLVASDVAARGLDIPAVSHVFNFDLPSHAEDYVHRIGRTGRAGRLGTAISIGVPADEKYLTAIEALVKQSLPRAPLPEGFALSAAAQDAPRAPRENGKRERGRDRDRNERRGRRDDSEQRRDREPVEQPKAEAPRQEPRSESRSEPRNEPRHESRGDQRPPRDERRGDQHRNERRDRGDRDSDRGGDRHPVMGMGEHMPEFMTRSFRPRIIETTHETDDSTEAAAVEAPAKARPPRAEQPKATPAPAEVMPTAPAAESAVSETIAAPEVQPVTEPAAEVVTEAAPEAPAVDAVEEAPKRKRKPRAPKAKPAQAPAAAEGADMAATEAASETGSETTEASGETPAEKPKRKSRAKAATTEAGTEKKPAKPRAPRKPRVKAATEQPATQDAETASEPSAQPEPQTGSGDKAEV